MFYPHSRPLTRAIHSLEHLAALSDVPSLPFCLSERTAYILQNLAVLDAVDSRRYARLINPYGYVPVAEEDEEWALFQSVVNNLCLELIGGECQQVKSHVLANTAVAQSIPNATWTVPEYGNIEWDVLGEYDSDGYLFRAEEAGIYLLSFSLLFAASTDWAVNEYALARVISEFAGGVTIDHFRVSATGFSQYVRLAGTARMQLSAGEAMQIEIYQNSGAARALYADAAQDWLFVDRLV